METRNVKYNRYGTINCEINHPTYGWSPFTASPDDSEQFGRDIHAEILSGIHGTIAAYVAPPIDVNAVRAGLIVTRFQALAALDAAGLLPSVEAIMANPATPNITKLAWNNALEFKRLSPTVVAFGATLGLTDEQLDTLFTQAKSIEA